MSKIEKRCLKEMNTINQDSQDKNENLVNFDFSIPEDWDAFRAGFNAAYDFYNNEIARKNSKWILLPDKAISNAFWKYKKDLNNGKHKKHTD